MQVISLSERSNEIVNFIEENEVYIPDEIQKQEYAAFEMLVQAVLKRCFFQNRPSHQFQCRAA